MTWYGGLGRRDAAGSPELLWEDGERRFCRTWRTDAGGARRPCLAVSPIAAHPTPASVDRLAHEFALRDCLDEAWALRPLELVRERERGRAVLLLEDGAGEPLSRAIGRPMPAQRFLRLAIALADALRHMHARGLVHKDIKPDNILVGPGDEVRLTGFGIATRVPRERQAPSPLEHIAGTLSHMAPEQTGRMNRSVDSRSDLYALGVTLYQMLTGTLPFVASEPMEWLHCHVARRPPPPGTRRAGVPPQLDALVMKLLEKTPEARYQSAAGVEHDLRRCLGTLADLGLVDTFPLGERDRPDRLCVPERLYGREREIERLVAAFGDVVAGEGSRLVLLTGPPGAGKSSLVNELHRALVPAHGLFAAGKFDQLRRDVPHATLAQAFRGLLRGLLARPEDELACWRDALREALGPDASLVAGLLPELAYVLGPLAPEPELPAPAARVRVGRALRHFTGAFARPEHPLVLFLDDLQWLDAATLDLLGALVAPGVPGHLLLVGAFRDDEVDAAHPLRRRIDALRTAGVRVEEIALAPLGQGEVAQLIGDALRCDAAAGGPLARVLHEKTGGNPFFATQFLQSLLEEGAIAFDAATGCWREDLARVRAKAHTENVVDLMVARLARLPAGTRRALKHLACLGHAARTEVLAIVLEAEPEAVHAELWEALRQELVVRGDDAYRFVHDRVQESAYSLVPADERAREHLRIGRLLDARLPGALRDELLFDVVAQLDRGARWITAREERDGLAAMNLAAGRRAAAAAAYGTALGYLETGTALLDDDPWRRHALAFALERHRAECEFLTADFEAAERRLEALATRAADAVERAAVACLLADLHYLRQRPERGVAACLACLARSGLAIPLHPTQAQVRSAYEQVRALVGDRPIESIAEQPAMTDPGLRATLEVLTKGFACARAFDGHLLTMLACAAARLSLEHGKCDSACYAYAHFGVVAGWHFGDHDASVRFARLALDMVEGQGLRGCQAGVYLTLATHAMGWAQHVAGLRDLLRTAFEIADREGDRSKAASAQVGMFGSLQVAGDPLPEVAERVDEMVDWFRRAALPDFIHVAGAQRAYVAMLRGRTRHFGVLDDGRFDEARMEATWAGEAHVPTVEYWYWVRKLQARWFAGDHRAALAAAARARELAWSSPALLVVADEAFYTALAHAGAHAGASEEDRRGHVAALRVLHAQLVAWAAHCRANFENRAALVGAELARLEGRDPEAMRLYERAMQSARENGFPHNEAIALECAAAFYAQRGIERVAHACLVDARYAYQRWGAQGKVRQLESRHPRLREGATHVSAAATVQSPVDHLELAIVLEVLQAVSGATGLESLIDTVMRQALAHAGAERAVLVMPHGDGHRVAAEATADAAGVHVRAVARELDAVNLPRAAILYVLRTHETVLLGDAGVASAFVDDAYRRRRRPRSLLCMPLLKQGRLIGVIHLENSLSPDVFTPGRLALLTLLASEAAGCLESANLYRGLQEREARVRRLVDSNIIGIVLWHRDGRILEANDAFLRMVGHARQEVVGGAVRWSDLSPPDWAGEDLRAMDAVRDFGAVGAFEREVLHRDGRRVPVLVGAASFDGTPDEGVGYFLDLSEIKRAEQAARESERRNHELQVRLADASRIASVGHLAAAIAHEINQPLAGIVTNASVGARLLACDPADLPAVGDTIRRTLRDAERASEVIRRLRSLFAGEESVAEEVDLNEITQGVAALLAADFRREGIALVLELETALPRLRGDRVQLQQVILNLLRNAAEATRDAGGRPRRVLLRTGLDGERVRLSVTDTGPGLDPAAAGRLFDAFRTTKADGMGIGLSVSRSIVERHRGTLRAADNDDGGATFFFVLPVPGPGGDRETAPPARAARPGGTP